MVDPVVSRFARTLVRYSVDIQPGDLLTIDTTTLAVPLVAEIEREAVRAGARLLQTSLAYDGQHEIALREAGPDQVDWVSPVDELVAREATAAIHVKASFNTRAASAVPREAAMQRRKAMAGVTGVIRQRMAEGRVKRCLTLFPTQASAQDAGMSLSDYEAFVFGAMFLDREDPIEEWRKLSAAQQRQVDLLSGIRTLRFLAEDTDLTLSVADRKWQNSDGRRNFPSGEVFTGPVEDSANGHVRFSFPLIAEGREIEGAHLWFEQGRVVKATAERGEDHLRALLATDAGSCYLGEAAVGNNYGIQRFTHNILFDEKIGGTFHLALGSAYLETGSRNQSAIHVDMVCDLREGGLIYGDGAVIHENGQWRA